MSLINVQPSDLLIDASSISGGGGLEHLKALIENFQPGEFESATVWTSRETSAKLGIRPFVKIETHPQLNAGLLPRTLWQLFTFPKVAKSQPNALVLSLTGLGCHRHKNKTVAVCHNQLPFEWREIKAAGFISPLQRRLYLLRRALIPSLSQAAGVIFLSEFSKERILSQLHSAQRRVAVIPHGVSEKYRVVARAKSETKEFRFLYVSTVFPYKHQDTVARAIAKLRGEGLPVSVRLVGGGDSGEISRLEKLVAELDPAGKFLKYSGETPQEALPGLLRDADGFVFASSCETFGISLVEAMAAGLPVACSDLRPMKDIARDAAVYFNPYSTESCAAALRRIVESTVLRTELSERGKQLAANYSWARCAQRTFEFLAEVAKA